MKTVKRAICLLMVLVMTFSGVFEPSVFGITAAAESVETRGTDEVGATPENVLSLGGWKYWIEDGIAIIAGYTGRESELSIPDKLSKYPVAGIGEKAFAPNNTLTSIYIPTNVTRIASDAFEGLSGVTVKAYNGAYALKYAEKYGLTGEAFTQPGVEFADGLIDLTGMPEASYYALNEGGVTFSTKYASFLEAGQVVYFPASPAFPTGYARKVNTIVSTGNEIFVTFSVPEWTEVFNRVYGDDKLFIDWDSAVYYENVEVQDVGSAGFFSKKSLYFEKKIGEDTLKTNVTISSGDATVSYDVDWEWKGIIKVPKLANLNINLPITTTLNITYGSKDKTYSKFTKPGSYLTESQAKKKFKVLDVNVFGIAGVITGDVGLYIYYEIEGGIAVSATAVTDVHISYTNGKPNSTSDTQINNVSLGLEAKAKCGPEFSLGFKLGWSGLSLTFLEGTIGYYIKLEGSAKRVWFHDELGSNASTKSISCVQGKLFGEGELSLKIGIVKLLDKEIEKYKLYAKLTRPFVKREVLSGHWDDFEKVDSCTLTSRKVKFLVDNKEYDSAAYDVGYPVNQPIYPIERGCIFEGWYVDMAKSGLQGADYKFDFKNDRMPYCGKNGTLTFYAKFKKILPESISLNKSSITAYTSDPAVDIKATILPKNAYNASVGWTSSDTSVAKVKDGKVSFVGRGTATIKATANGNTKVYATCSVTVKQYVTKIDVNGELPYMVPGENLKLNAAVSPSNANNRNVNWSSSNSSIASVDANGNVTAKAPGTVQITATAADGGGARGSYTVYVLARPVTGISLNRTESTEYTNNKAGVQLVATIEPANAEFPGLKWSSSDSSIATVDTNGLVHFIAPGTAVITCTSVSRPSVKAQSIFNVRQYAEQIDVDSEDFYAIIGHTSQLIETVYPANTSDKRVSWSSSDPELAEVDEYGRVTFKGHAGDEHFFKDVYFTATAKDGSGVKGSYMMRAVNYEPVMVSSIVLDTRNLVGYTDEKDGHLLIPTVYPEDADYKAVKWTSSNPAVASVDANGKVSFNYPGTATITCRSVSTKKIYTTCVVTVKQHVEKLEITGLQQPVNPGDTFRLGVNVYPANATDKSVTWKSSKPEYATVDADGTVHCLADGFVEITVTANDGSGVMGRTGRFTVGNPVKYKVDSVTLDITEAEIYTNERDGFVCTPTIEPDDAYDVNVRWTSSDNTVATVDAYGQIRPVFPGTAVITCQSVFTPEVTATCRVTVKQYVENIFIDCSSRILVGETEQISASVYPEYATEKGVTWSVSDPSILSLSADGTLKTLKPGTATITATAKDGGGAETVYTVIVEKQLQLESNIVNDTVYTQGEENCILAGITLSTPSMLRMAKAGYMPEWSLTKKSDNSDAELAVIVSALSTEDINTDTSFAMLTGSTFTKAGTEEYTVTCKAGPYTDSVDIAVTVDGGSYAREVKLTDTAIGYNSFNTSITGSTLIPAQPFSADGGRLPEGMQAKISGDYYYNKYAQQQKTDDGFDVRFDESGIYTANVHYSKANLGYDVTGTWYVADENGVVRRRVEDIELSDSFISILETESYASAAIVYPEDAYDKSLTWTSNDETIATVTADGVITGIKPGTTSIICSANDGSDIFAMLTVNVQDYLQLDESALEYTVYTGGSDHVSLGTVNVTRESGNRLVADGRNVTWKLEKLSGNSTELAINEFAQSYENGISVNGNQLVLLRVTGEGTDEYLITCTTDGYTAVCPVTIHAVAGNLPEELRLNETEYSCNVNDYLTLNTQYTLSPVTAELPEGTEMTVEGGRAYTDALSPLYSFSEPEKLIFEKPGTYTANVIFSGTNYSYTCPVTIRVADEEGNVPVAITDIVLDQDMLNMFAGDTATLTAEIQPGEAVHSAIRWSSTDTSVATVSDTGEVTAIGRGYAMIVASVPESDYDGSCLVYVEDGLTLFESELERTVFVDGATRMTLDTLMLTDNSSTHLTEAPEWSLRRVSGISLTLKAEPYETVNDKGETLYGCELKLYSVSKEGDTVYELTCTSGEERVSVPITVHAVYRDRVLPASIEFDKTRFEADVGELITAAPVITAYPAGTALPQGIRIKCEGDRQFTAALNAEDCFVSQSLSTFSFSKPGTYNANFIYSYSNVKYVIPVVFGIRDENGEIPVQASKFSLSEKSLYMTVGENTKLEAVFTPADATNQRVTWQSTDPTVASVDAEGRVQAKKLGIANIFCIPEDTECTMIRCAVTVEEPLSVTAGTDQALLYMQGKEDNIIAAVRLSEGTRSRFERLGLSPEWTLEKDGVTVAELDCEETQKPNGVNIRTTALNKAGKDTYTIRCTAGEYEWSREYSLEVIDLNESAPESVTIAQPQVSVAVGEVFTLDFTPVVRPSGAKIPDAMTDYGFVGVGGFYDALDRSVYRENGETVTLAFTKPGQYILTRQFVHRNLKYLTQCVITVGDKTGLNVLNITEKDYTIYNGGRSGVISTVSLNDAMIGELWGSDIVWSAERVSGDSVVAALKANGATADVFAANVLHNGTDVWRIKCSFGGTTQYADISITAADPRGTIPESVSLGKDTYKGMIGNWIAVPLGVSCSPAGSMLPDQGDEFWSFALDTAGEERSSHSIQNGMLNIYFLAGGYYTGTLTYKSGNVSYSVPVYFVIQDEEEEVAAPMLNMYLVNCFDTVYPEGETGVAIGQAVMADTLSTYSTGAAVAYMKSADARWKINTEGGGALLKLSRVSDNVYDIILAGVKAPGDLSYTVSCTVNGKETRQATGLLHVASAGEPRPEPTLTRTRYTASVGVPVTIDTRLVSSQEGSVLKSVGTMDYSGLLSAVGYEVKETNGGSTMTFYQPGEYSAELSAYMSNIKVSSTVKITVTDSQEPVVKTTLVLPKALTAIESGAFEGLTAEVVDMRNTKVASIGDGAFASCVDLSDVYLPDTVTSIADNAFYGCLNVQLHCNAGSYAAAWAEAHGFSVVS